MSQTSGTKPEKGVYVMTTSTRKAPAKAAPAKGATILGGIRAAAKPETVPVVATAVPAAVPAPAAPIDWSSMSAPTIAVYTRAASKVDVEAATPRFIRDAVALAFETTVKAGSTTFFMQECGTAEVADEFMKLARRYCTYKGYTLRGEANPVKVATGPGEFASGVGKVKFAVKLKESRPKKA